MYTAMLCIVQGVSVMRRHGFLAKQHSNRHSRNTMHTAAVSAVMADFSGKMSL